MGRKEKALPQKITLLTSRKISLRKPGKSRQYVSKGNLKFCIFHKILLSLYELKLLLFSWTHAEMSLSSSSSSCSGRIRFDSCSLYPQNEAGPSISSSVVLCVFVKGQSSIWSQGLYRCWYVKPINPEKNQPQQQRRLCRQIRLPRPRGLRPRDPWAMQQKLQQTGEGAGEGPAP